MAETPGKNSIENQSQSDEGVQEEAVGETPKKTSSVRSKVGNVFKRAFTPRRNAGSGDIPNVVEHEPTDESDGKSKKKSGIGAAIRGLGSKIKSPRKTMDSTERTADVSTDVKRKVEEESSDLKAIVKESAEAVPNNVEQGEQETSKSTAYVKHQVIQGVVDTDEKAKVVVSDMLGPAHATAVETGSEAMTREVEVACIKASGQIENAQVERRDVGQPAEPVLVRREKAAKDKNGRRKSRRGPLLSALGLALGIGFIAMRLMMK